MHTRGHKQGLRWVRKMRTWLGRLIRDIQRKIAGNPDLEAAFKVALQRAEKIHGQQPDDKAKLYALHAPEVECIGKGVSGGGKVCHGSGGIIPLRAV
jgi:IS5 family transposase